MALHIRHFQVPAEDGVYFADLQLARDADGVAPRVRITRRRNRGAEKFVGYAGLNRACELIRRPEGVSERDAEAIEAAIAERLGLE